MVYEVSILQKSSFTSAFQKVRPFTDYEKILYPCVKWSSFLELFGRNILLLNSNSQILATTPFGKEKKGEVGIERLVGEGAYTAAFPLHDVSQWFLLPLLLLLLLLLFEIIAIVYIGCRF